MKKNGHSITKDILFYAKKLPAIKQVEALDFIKWLWVSKKSEEGWQGRFDALLKRVWKNVKKNPPNEEEIDNLVEEVRAERYAKSSR